MSQPRSLENTPGCFVWERMLSNGFSWVRLGVSMRLFPHLSLHHLNELLHTHRLRVGVQGRRAMLCPEERDWVRAGYVRKVLRKARKHKLCVKPFGLRGVEIELR